MGTEVVMPVAPAASPYGMGMGYGNGGFMSGNDFMPFILGAALGGNGGLFGGGSKESCAVPQCLNGQVQAIDEQLGAISRDLLRDGAAQTANVINGQCGINQNVSNTGAFVKDAVERGTYNAALGFDGTKLYTAQQSERTRDAVQSFGREASDRICDFEKLYLTTSAAQAARAAECCCETKLGIAGLQAANAQTQGKIDLCCCESKAFTHADGDVTRKQMSDEFRRIDDRYAHGLEMKVADLTMDKKLCDNNTMWENRLFGMQKNLIEHMQLMCK